MDTLSENLAKFLADAQAEADAVLADKNVFAVPQYRAKVEVIKQAAQRVAWIREKFPLAKIIILFDGSGNPCVGGIL